MLDNRLDHMGDFIPGTIEKMTEMRKLFIALDKELCKLGEVSQTGHRSLSISRTNLETSLMYAIKTLCIQGEKPK